MWNDKLDWNQGSAISLRNKQIRFFNVTFSQFWFIFSTLFSLLRCNECSLYQRDFFGCQRTEMQMFHRLMVIDREESRQTGLRMITWLEWNKWIRQNAGKLRASESHTQSNVKGFAGQAERKRKNKQQNKQRNTLKDTRAKRNTWRKREWEVKHNETTVFIRPSLYLCSSVPLCYTVISCFADAFFLTWFTMEDAVLCPVFYCILHFAWASWTELVETDLRYEAGFISH